jgi:hypothetical protein
MKYAPRWNYENIWLVYGLAGMVVLPRLLTLETVPQISQVYALSSAKTLFSIAGFGMCWGIGATLSDHAGHWSRHGDHFGLMRVDRFPYPALDFEPAATPHTTGAHIFAGDGNHAGGDCCLCSGRSIAGQGREPATDKCFPKIVLGWLYRVLCFRFALIRVEFLLRLWRGSSTARPRSGH